MPVSDSDIKVFKSSTGASVGGTVTATECGLAKNDLWPDISDAERIAGGTRTKKVFFKNGHATDALLLPKFWIYSSPTGFSPDQIGYGWNDSDDDAPAQGNMTAFGANAVAALIADGADTRTASLIGRNGSSVPTTEDVVLNGSTEVLSTTTWSKLYAVKLSAESGSRTVTIKQGTGGTTRGTIAPNVENCWLWIQASSEATSIVLPDVVAGGYAGFWWKETWPAGVAADRPNESIWTLKES